MKALIAVLLLAATAAGAGDMVVFGTALRDATVNLGASVTAALDTYTRDVTTCNKQASRPKRDKCNATALTSYTAAVTQAETTYNVATLPATGAYLGVPATTADITAELIRLEALQFAQDFALQQAKIDACLLANAGSTDPNVCNDLTGY